VPIHLTTLGVGAVVLALQLFSVNHTGNRAVRRATASIAILICTALLVSGHYAQRMRSPKHESLDTMLLRDRPAAVSIEPSADPLQRPVTAVRDAGARLAAGHPAQHHRGDQQPGHGPATQYGHRLQMPPGVADLDGDRLR
jgi:hypothetical protein